jgi:hypothetical protein
VSKKKAKLTPKQAKFAKGIAEGKTQTDAALDAGYSPLNPDRSGYQAMEALRKRMPDLCDELGLTDRAIIEKYVVPLLEAKETKFFAFRKETKRGVTQVIDEREVEALGIRATALNILCNIKGIYAPRQVEFDPAGKAPAVINLGGLSRPN